MRNHEKETKAIEKLEFVVEEFTNQLGQVALEVLKYHGDDLDTLDQPEVLAPEDVNEDSLIEREVEFDDWKFIVNKILKLTNQQVFEVINSIEAFDSNTF